ncbi:SMP-30/gluconolactonase/LRE family protein [Geofilum rubicundum]|nr:SMP-30/gluconolactonase/LRE family protein [Geofilum rubicundum]
MKTHIFITLLTSLLLTSSCVQSPKDQRVVAEGAQPILLSNQFTFTEGPATDKQGNVYFTDQPNNQIIKWTQEDNSFSVFTDSSHRSNGMYFDREGKLISCADLNNQLISINQNGELSILAEGYNGLPLNGPNDLWIDNKGGIYITDPYYQRPWWNHQQMPQDAQCVYYLNPQGTQLTRVADKLQAPNGIIGTPDNTLLYVSDIADGKTYSYQIQADGSLSNRKLLFEKGSDGMTLDQRGNIYITNADGVTVFNKEGQQIDQILIPEDWTANVTFGGKERNKLFITASKSVYLVDMKVKGAY